MSQDLQFHYHISEVVKNAQKMAGWQDGRYRPLPQEAQPHKNNPEDASKIQIGVCVHNMEPDGQHENTTAGVLTPVKNYRAETDDRSTQK